MAQSQWLLIFLQIWIFDFLDCTKADSNWNTKDYQKREHCLAKPYHHGGPGGMPLWDFGGTAMITSNYVRLTSDKQASQGYIWNSVPVSLRDWELHLHFRVWSQSKRDLFGDGFTFWYTKDRMSPGPVFGNMDYFTGLGIFLDTYNNHNGPHNHAHPYISAMVSNGSVNYDHDLDGTHTSLSGCEAQFRNKDYDTFVLVRYENNKLTVKMDIDNKRAWKECFEVAGVHLPTGFYFGISAATGDLTDNHDIISVKTYELAPMNLTPGAEEEDPSSIVPHADYAAAPRDRHDDPEGGMSGLSIFFIVLGILLAVVVVGVVIVMLLDSSSNTSSGPGRKRFY